MITLDLDDFRDAVAVGAVPVAASCDRPDGFRAGLAQARWHGITISQVDATAHTVERDEALVREAPARGCLVVLVLDGAVEVAQDGRAARLEAGRLALVDGSRPFRLAADGEHRMLVVEFPRDRICLPERLLGGTTAQPVAVDGGLGAVVASFLVPLAAHPGLLASRAGARLALNAIDLLGTLLARDLDDAAAGLAARQQWFEQVCAEIESRLDDPRLAPAELAEAAHISLRQLYLLFHERGQTVAGYIRARRLDGAYLDLIDPTAAELPIAAIGAKWGFPAAAHFSRAFREAFGTTPTAVRAGGECREEARPLPAAASGRAAAA